MSSDIRDIIRRLQDLEEGKITPTTIKQGLNKQQKSVPQLPALFKPKHISVLGADKDPQHPMKGMAVGANESRLAEAMAEIEEDMVSKVRKDLNAYLDQLSKKNPDDGRRDKDSTPELDKLSAKQRQYRDMIEKAVNAISAAEEVEEELAENDYELNEPETDHAAMDNVDAKLAQPQQPIKVMEIDGGAKFEIHECDNGEYEIRHNGRPLKSRFGSVDDADMAVQLFQAHRAKKAKQDLSQDYIEER